ncbi:MAG: RnfABCDGE type electron transport complex subunit D, partial [Proteobacteria bacterium]|nr:RnfABCDGE type electron transport complex subunit D [Pseudomonadota bacterium]
MSELTVSISPHIRNRESVPKIMWTVIACLMPVLVLSTVLFGWQQFWWRFWWRQLRWWRCRL